MTTTHEIERARSGDVAAFEVLYRSHVARVYSLACRMAGRDVADELTQDVFVRVWQRLDSFRGDAAFSTWLHRVAANVITEYFRRAYIRRAREAVDVTVLDRAPAVASSPGMVLDVDAAIERLPDGARQVFVLFDVEGYTHLEIADMLGLSVGTSKSQLHRARMLLRAHLGQTREGRES